MQHARPLTAVLVATLGASATSAVAGGPALEVTLSVDGQAPRVIAPSGRYIAASDRWAYSGTVEDLTTGVTVEFDLTASADPPLLSGGGFTVENLSTPQAEIVVTCTMPLSTGPAPATTLSGSAAITLTTDSGGGTLATIPGTPLWQAIIDGASVEAATLFADPFSLSLPGLGSTGDSANFGLPSGVAGPPVTSQMGLALTLSLTQFDQFSSTGVMLVNAPAVPNGPCPWDVDGSGAVDVADIQAVIGAWSFVQFGPPDMNGDQFVSIVDLLDVLAHWGPCP